MPVEKPWALKAPHTKGSGSDADPLGEPHLGFAPFADAHRLPAPPASATAARVFRASCPVPASQGGHFLLASLTWWHFNAKRLEIFRGTDPQVPPAACPCLEPGWEERLCWERGAQGSPTVRGEPDQLPSAHLHIRTSGHLLALLEGQVATCWEGEPGNTQCKSRAFSSWRKRPKGLPPWHLS